MNTPETARKGGRGKAVRGLEESGERVEGGTGGWRRKIEAEASGQAKRREPAKRREVTRKGSKDPSRREGRTKGALGRWWNAESCRNMIGAVNRRERQRRASKEIAGTEAGTQQKRDQRGPTPKRGSKGITKGAASARTKESAGGRASKGPRSCDWRLQQANQRR